MESDDGAAATACGGEISVTECDAGTSETAIDDGHEETWHGLLAGRRQPSCRHDDSSPHGSSCPPTHAKQGSSVCDEEEPTSQNQGRGARWMASGRHEPRRWAAAVADPTSWTATKARKPLGRTRAAELDIPNRIPGQDGPQTSATESAVQTEHCRRVRTTRQKSWLSEREKSTQSRRPR